MSIVSTNSSILECQAEFVVVGYFAGKSMTGSLAQVDQATGGAVQKLLASEEFTGKKAELVPLFGQPGLAGKHALLLGLGDPDKLDACAAYRLAASASKWLSSKVRQRVAFYLAESLQSDFHEAAMVGSLVGCVGQDLFRGSPNRHPIQSILWQGVQDQVLASANVIGDSVNLARNLVNQPPNEIYPASFAKLASERGADAGLEVVVWDEKRLEKERCDSLLAVGLGSNQPSRLVILEHHGAPRGAKTLALVGKGVTYDSGGLCIKPPEGMKTMKCDMAGAAAVVAAMLAIAKLKLPVRVVGLCGLVENMLGGGAFKVGDVVRARSGKTIEVLNTDAEGRMVLADVLDVALGFEPAKIVDAATLTGACVVALGMDVAGVLANNDAWANEIISAAKSVGEPAWQLPMFADYGDHIRSEVADIKNVGEGRWAGAMAGAKFLEEFVNGKPWAHVDIAGPAFLESAKPWSDAGGTGCMTRTFIELARRWQ